MVDSGEILLHSSGNEIGIQGKTLIPVEKIKAIFIPDRVHLPDRRYDLDWLRILAFALLIFYHTGMLYVADWSFHVKSQYLSENLQTIMLLVNPWRMLILWMISGIAIRFILAKVSLGRFVVQRSYRLLLPLLFGILVIVPPQLYYEMNQNGDLAIGYWEFYRQFFDLDNPLFKNYSPGIWHHIDVNHLWYLRELWRFSLYLIFLLPVLNSHQFGRAIDWLARLNGYMLVTIITLPVFTIQLIIDDTKEPLGFLFLVYGYILGWHPILWQRLKDNSNRLLIFSLICYVFFALFYNLVWKNASEELNQLLLIGGTAIYSLDRILWVMLALAFGFRFLNQKSSKLNYFNDAVYPYYILHQTVIIAVGYEMTQFKLGPVFEPVIVLLATFSLCAIGFEIIRRVDMLRVLFGLKLNRCYQLPTIIFYKSVTTLLVLGLALEILV